MEVNPIGRLLVEQIEAISGESNFLSQAPQIAISVLSALTALVVVVITGTILAAKPHDYRDGVVALFPQSSRGRLREAFDLSGRALKLWLIGQVFSMIVIGVLIGVGLSIVGVPSALALGLFAALAQFVPLIGPIVAAIPGLIIAAATGTDIFLWALVVYLAVQQFEGNFLTPVAERRTASLPIPITLFAVLAFGLLFGLPGVILATPLAVVVYVLVKKLYMRDLLGDDVSLPGEKKHGRRRHG